MWPRNAGLRSSRVKQAVWCVWWQRRVWAGRSLRPSLTCQQIRLQRQLVCIRKMTLTRGLFSNRAEQLVHYGAFRGSQRTSFSLFVCAQPTNFDKNRTETRFMRFTKTLRNVAPRRSAPEAHGARCSNSGLNCMCESTILLLPQVSQFTEYASICKCNLFPVYQSLSCFCTFWRGVL